MKSREETTEQLKEDLRKTREELVIQKWGIEKTLGGMKILVKELFQKGKEVEEAKAKDEAILSSIGDGLVAVDKAGKILMVNKAFEELLGWKQDEVIGKPMAEVIPREDEARNRVLFEERILTQVLAGKKVTTTTTTNVIIPVFYYIRKDGTKFPTDSIITPIVLDNKIIGAVETFRDITKEKEIDRMKTEFVDLASHQLRTPLTGIEWTVDAFARKEKLTDEGKNYLQDIRFSAKRLNALVKLLLNASRIAGSVGVVPESTDLMGLMNEYFRECQVLFKKKNLTFLISVPENLVVITDKNLYGHILQNLVSNSIEYTPDGGTIEVLLEKRENTFLLTVRNTSAAIPQKDQSRIFEKFFRSPAAVAIKPDGTGLGLYIVSEAVKLLGGKVWFESPLKDREEGTVFYVELPLQVLAKAGGKHLVDHPFE